MCFNGLKKLFLFNIFIGICYCLFNIAAAETLDTKLSRDKVALGETVTISFTLDSVSTDAQPDLSPLEKDFRVLSTNYGTSVKILNGATQAKTFWHVTLEPKSAGELIIPEISFGSNKSSSRKILVEDAPKAAWNTQRNTVDFVQAELNTATPYIQSQVIYTFKLFYRSRLENPTIEAPQINDGILIPVGGDKSYQTIMKGEQFFVYEKNFAFFPQKVGKLTIPSTHFRALKYDISLASMNDPFYINTTKPITLATQSLSLDVQKIPDHFEGKTWLPAKDISLNETWSTDPNQLWELGNPITRTITVKAQGLRADQLPDFAFENIPGLNIYADRPQRSNDVHGDSVVGTLKQKITYLPNQSQSFTLPALKLIWWNTQTNSNAIAELKPITVQVQTKIGSTPAASSSVVTTIAASKTPTQNSNDINVKNTKLISTLNTPFYWSIWFWISIFLLVSWAFTLWLLLQKKRNSKPSNYVTIPNSQPLAHSIKIADKFFVQACEQGDVLMAQKFLLSWAATHWHEPPLHLAKLRELINDENFKNELENLEKSIYAKKVIPWNGHALLAAYQHLQKQKKNKFVNPTKTRSAKDNNQDPLPPLNP